MVGVRSNLITFVVNSVADSERGTIIVTILKKSTSINFTLKHK